MIEIYNENCFDTMLNRLDENVVDVILTSPPYNTNRRAGLNRNLLNNNTKGYPDVRYDSAIDIMSDEQYSEFTEKLFNGFDKILKPNGCVLYNISYGTENTEGMFLAINAILTKTNFTIADTIIWKKKSAVPNNVSSNKLTRICEFVFVFCRKSEFDTFNCNKQVKTHMPSGQNVYENVFNYVEAPNNNGVCPYNKATYSVELCEWLLSLSMLFQTVQFMTLSWEVVLLLLLVRRMILIAMVLNYQPNNVNLPMNVLKLCQLIHPNLNTSIIQENYFSKNSTNCLDI